MSTGRPTPKAPHVALAWLRCAEACLERAPSDPNCTQGPMGFTVRCLDYDATSLDQIAAIAIVAEKVSRRITSETRGMDEGSEMQLRRRSALLECQSQLCAWLRSQSTL